MTKAWSFIKDRLRVGEWYGIGLSVGVACFAHSILSFVAIVDSLSGKGTLFLLDLKINAGIIWLPTDSKQEDTATSLLIATQCHVFSLKGRAESLVSKAYSKSAYFRIVPVRAEMDQYWPPWSS
jgi:hypothetical protein